MDQPELDTMIKSNRVILDIHSQTEGWERERYLCQIHRDDEYLF